MSDEMKRKIRKPQEKLVISKYSGLKLRFSIHSEMNFDGSSDHIICISDRDFDLKQAKEILKWLDKAIQYLGQEK